MDTQQAVNDRINWEALKSILAMDIRVAEAVRADMADYPATVARQEARIEALKDIQRSMATLERVLPGAADTFELTEFAAGRNGESVRIGEDYDQAATDYARIETGEL